jgi:hypothetical protein
MAKKSKRKSSMAKEQSQPNNANTPGLKQTAGAVSGAVLGGVVGGPIGALAGGALGAMVGDSSAKGQKPVKRAVDAIREEITSGRAKAALKSVGERIKSLRPGGQDAAKKEVASKKSVKSSAGVKKKKKAKAATRKATSSGAKSKKTTKSAVAPKIKHAKKK